MKSPEARWVTSPDIVASPAKAVERRVAAAGLGAALRDAVRRTPPRGFTLIELMLTIAILGLLAAISVNELGALVMYAKRTEAVTGLSSLWTAQRAHYLEHGTYAQTFKGLDFELYGGMQLSPTSYKGGRYTYQLSQPWGPASYYCIATAQLDADPWPDILEVYEFGE